MLSSMRLCSNVPAQAIVQTALGGYQSVAEYVKPGGTLVYSTCTITKEENAENADWIEKNLPFEKKEIRDLLPEALKASCEENRIQLLPGVHPCDGFFISAFRRK